MKTREQYIEEYSQLGNAAIPIAIYDVGENVKDVLRDVGNSLVYEIKLPLRDAATSISYSLEYFRSVCIKITDSYDGPLIHFKNTLSAFRKSLKETPHKSDVNVSNWPGSENIL